MGVLVPVPVVVLPATEVELAPPMAMEGATDEVGDGPRLLKLVPAMAEVPVIVLLEAPPGVPPPPAGAPPPVVVVVEGVPPVLVLGACANKAEGANSKR